MTTDAQAMRGRRLCALGVEPLQLRVHGSAVADARHASTLPDGARAVATPPASTAVPVGAPLASMIRRLALQPDPVELDDPAIRKMYESLTEAVGKAGLQRVRVCDVADDPTSAVMLFGAAPLPEGVPVERVLREDPLSVLHADRERKRRLWGRMQALGRSGS